MMIKTNSVSTVLSRLISEEGLDVLIRELERDRKKPVIMTQEQMEQGSRLFNLLLYDTCSDDTQIRKLCKQVLPDKVVDGDSYGVPGPVDLVELLVGEIKRLRKQ